MESGKIKVLYVAGWGRSGTTIMDNIFGQLDGFFSVGEIRYIWERSFMKNRLCGCRRPFLECDVWQEIIASAYGRGAPIDAARLNAMTYRYTRTLRILSFLLTRGGSRSTGMAEYLSLIEKLYLAIARTTGCRVIVDSSKFPLYGGALRLIPSLDVHIVHLVRDPRAVAHSWMNPKKTNDTTAPEMMIRLDPVFSSVQWDAWNLTIDYLGSLQPDKYLRLNYEAFVSQPRASVERILAMLGEPSAGLPFEDDFTVRLGVNHTTSGNPNRFQSGSVAIKADTRWEREMPAFYKGLVTALTLPFLGRYGYRP